ncbi:MAG: pirin family protein [Gammaproteobacteria bacterium]|nr:pirin family protein [Gammaproteobacteria bacterium]NND60655.1 pirin family protein [Gammaproteobacteria bacterium]
MSMSSVKQVVEAMPASEGAGVRIYRAIGTPALQSLDPFLMLDFFGSDRADDYLAGFPDHPHRGFITITYMLDGRMRHRDSMGNEGVLQPGDVQWMKAASGVIHSEMPEQQDGLMRGFQLWLNLPASEKMSDPEYRDIASETIPEATQSGVAARVIAGSYAGTRGVIVDPFTDLLYLDLDFELNATTVIENLEQRNAFVFVYEGRLSVDGEVVAERQLATLDTARCQLVASEADTKAIVVAGKPLEEPVAKYGPFVMNYEGEIRKAMLDFQQGQLVRKRASNN